MDKSQLIEYCLSKNLAYLNFPFASNDYAVVKIKNKKTDKSRIFAEIFCLKDKDILTFSADKEMVVHLRNQFPNSITKGWHCPPLQAQYKSSVAISDFSDEMIKKFVDLSFSYICEKLKIN